MYANANANNMKITLKQLLQGIKNASNHVPLFTE